MPVTASDYPNSLDTLANPTSSTLRNDPGYELDEVIARAQNILEALEAKLGAGASTPGALQALMVTSAGLTKWGSLGRPNLLVNGWFPIWQQGTTPTPTPTDNLYGPDQWRVLMENASGVTITQETSDLPTDGSPYACKLTVGSGNNGKFGLWQPIAYVDAKGLRNKTVSLQAKLKSTAGITDARIAVMEFTSTADAITGDPISAWGAALTNPTLASNWSFLGTPAAQAVTTSWDTYRVEGLTVGASANNLAVLVWNDDRTTTQTTDILHVTDIKLEEGEFCTAFPKRDAAEEMARATWFFQRFSSTGTNTLLCTGIAIGTQSAVVYIPWRRFMRAAPAITVANADLNVPDAALANSGTGTIGTKIASTFGGQFTISAIGGSVTLTAGHAVMARWAGSASYLEADARL